MQVQQLVWKGENLEIKVYKYFTFDSDGCFLDADGCICRNGNSIDKLRCGY